MRSIVLAGVAIFALLAAIAVFAGEDEPKKDEVKTPAGIAAKYIGDKGLEKHPDVIFIEHFEDSLEKVKTRWDEVKNREIMTLDGDVPAGSAGRKSLLVSHVGRKNDTGGHLYRRLLPGNEKLYLRFYVKFDPDCSQIHHFVHLGGYNPPTKWPQGGAGSRPKGNERFSTGVEPFGNAWQWDFYSYWMDMRGSPGGKFWGNTFIRDPKLKVIRGKWICVELMMKMNTPISERNGEQAIWIDGKPWEKDGHKVSHLGKGFPKGKWVHDKWNPSPDGEPFEGFRWRSDEKLKLNFLWLLVYITKAREYHLSRIWFDHVVVAKNYIGPIGVKKKKK